MYRFRTDLNEVYNQGVVEGRRQILADLAKMWKDNESIEEFANDVYNYLDQEGYL